MLLAAGQPIKVISDILGHATAAFTADVYTEVAEGRADAAASAIAAYVPPARARSPPAVPALCQPRAKMISKTRPGALRQTQSPWSAAEARGFEPRKGANPNRISSSGRGSPDRFSQDQCP